MDTQIKKILITGGLGYIGSHLTVIFAKAGYKIIIIDNGSNSHPSTIDALEMITNQTLSCYQIDIGDADGLQNVFDDHPEIEGIIHCAAKKAVGESCEHPYLYYHNNISEMITLLEVIKQNNINRFIFSSSATVYDSTHLPPYVETDPTRTESPYGTTKLMGEYILKDLSRYDQLYSLSLRYFNPIGAHHSGLIGEDPEGKPNNLVPYIFKAVLGQIPPLTVYGNDYKTKDGTGIRDYIHVMDLAEAHLKAYEYLVDIEKTQKSDSKVGFFDIYNVGTGEGTSVMQMIDLVKKVTEKNVPYTIGPRRDGDVAVSLCNPQKIEKNLARKAKRTIRQAIQDHRNFIKKRYPS